MRKWFAFSFIALVAALSLVSVSPKHTLADQRDFTVVNGSSIIIVNLYVSSAATNSWEEDILGQDVLAQGDSVTIHFGKYDAGNCMYDIKVIGKNGELGYLYGVDLCSTDTVTFVDN